MGQTLAKCKSWSKAYVKNQAGISKFNNTMIMNKICAIHVTNYYQNQMIVTAGVLFFLNNMALFPLVYPNSSLYL